MPAAIRTHQLTKRYKQRTAVDSLDLDVQQGEVFGFLGPNGAGKTTTIGMLLGLVKPTSGSAEVLGHDIQRAPKAALARVGAMIEAPAFYPYLSGRDNLRALALVAGVAERRCEELLATVGLAERAGDRFRTYSLGMRQRLGIAAALINDPQLIILDEPTNGLDPAGQHDIRNLIRSLAADGRAIFLCSHTLPEVEQVCERVAILKSGRVVAQGRVADLLHQQARLLVRVAGELARAAQLLRGQPWAAGVEERGEALVVDAPAERAADVTMLLAQHEIAVTEIHPLEQRLEDFFMDVTRTAG